MIDWHIFKPVFLSRKTTWVHTVFSITSFVILLQLFLCQIYVNWKKNQGFQKSKFWIFKIRKRTWRHWHWKGDQIWEKLPTVMMKLAQFVIQTSCHISRELSLMKRLTGRTVNCVSFTSFSLLKVLFYFTLNPKNAVETWKIRLKNM